MAAEGLKSQVRWLAYSRVSTDRQEHSGQGLEAQWALVAAMAAECGALIVAEFVEVERGRRNDRPQLAAAQARAENAVIVVAKIDWLARDSGFVLKLANEVEKNGMGGFVFCDLPEIDATTSAGRMVLTMMTSVAEFEARRISERTKEALAAAKARGGVLGDTGQVQPSSLVCSSRRVLRRPRICVEFSSQWLVQV